MLNHLFAVSISELLDHQPLFTPFFPATFADTSQLSSAKSLLCNKYKGRRFPAPQEEARTPPPCLRTPHPRTPGDGGVALLWFHKLSRCIFVREICVMHRLLDLISDDYVTPLEQSATPVPTISGDPRPLYRSRCLSLFIVISKVIIPRVSPAR